MDEKKFIDIAAGRVKADLVLKNAFVLNVFTKEFIKQDVAIADGYIAGVGQYEGVVEKDLTGKFVCPDLSMRTCTLSPRWRLRGILLAKRFVAVQPPLLPTRTKLPTSRALTVSSICWRMRGRQCLPVRTSRLFPSIL